jgi:hypothetical protein
LALHWGWERETAEVWSAVVNGKVCLLFLPANPSPGAVTDGPPPSRPSHQQTRLQRRLYLQPTDDDPTHDEALSNRVAALNMHDLALEDLDVDVSRVGDQCCC